MINIAKEKKFEDALRQTALELLMTLTEAAPGMVRKVSDFTNQVIPVALEMMTDMEDEEKWYTTDDVSVFYECHDMIWEDNLVNSCALQ